MPRKTIFTATDSNGFVHKRSTESRAYTHTVVVRGGYQHDLAGAADKAWDKSMVSNFEYYLAIAEDRSPYYPTKRYRAENPAGWTAEQIAEEEAYLTAGDAESKAKAVREVEGHTVRSYVDAQRRDRIAAVEAKKAEGHYEKWLNAGWCGRLDLADKLAAKHRIGDHEVAILPAVKA